ncbi:MAG: S1 RNA-binding domain-containing protein [Acidobacteriaceae bacterium]
MTRQVFWNIWHVDADSEVNEGICLTSPGAEPRLPLRVRKVWSRSLHTCGLRSDPSEAVKTGQIVRVKVLTVDSKSKRIGLSIKALFAPAPRPAPKQQAPPAPAGLNDKLAALSVKRQTRT